MISSSWRDWVFSGKAFLAGMLALYIALSLDLSRPYWALSAVYIVSNPFSGATKSKALYRVLGTLIGASAAVAVVPVFVNAPELLSLVVALWTGTLLFVSMLDRTARSYVFMLAGYTLPLIALPAVGSPDEIFDLALSRSEEITLGILCASAVNTIILPASIGAVFGDRINRWLVDAGNWADEILRGEGAVPVTPLKRQKLASDVTGLDLLISQLSYDPGTKDVVGHARALRSRLLMLLPTFSSMADRLYAVRQGRGHVPEELASLLNDIADWFKLGNQTQSPLKAQEFLTRIEAQQGRDKLDCWDDLVLSGLLMRLKDVVELWCDCLTLRDAIASGSTSAHSVAIVSRRPLPDSVRHFDHALLALKAGIVVVGILVACAIWIGLQWAQGASFVAMAAVACSFFAAQDRPAVMIRSMFLWTAMSVLASFVYVFGILPAATSFEMMVLALTPFLLFLGLRMTNPQNGTLSMLLAVNVATLIGFEDRYTADLTSFANGAIATLLGIGFAYVWVSLTHPFGADFAAKRLLKAGWQDLADAAAGMRANDSALLSSRILDRLGQLVPRLAAANEHHLQSVDGFADVRLGINVITLQRARVSLCAESAEQISRLLLSVADHYRRQCKAGHLLDAADALCAMIDKGLEVVTRNEGAQARGVIDALVGLRRVFFAHGAAPDLHSAPPTQIFSNAAE